ncbi:MAG: cytochrome-c oxidase, cbb3-type subunit III, partial [Xanthomonadales bacterium]|nr:cytochrome-c oxidase, cbb3-type subunit III [Xanthomonadales bacterium]NIX12993.1 cytochrome-c oxidase, cbb3-type subunit III [Xanthomonadales bacterium]
MLSSFWNWYVIILTVASVLGCWWLLQWTKGISNREGDDVGTTGHTWDEDLEELNNPLPRWWLYLFHITIIFTLVYLVMYPGLGNVRGLLDWTQVGQYEDEMALAKTAQEDVYAQYRDLDPAALAADAEAMGIGRRIFANNCAMCHGSDGRGAPGFPNLTDDDWLYGNDFNVVLASVTQGRSGSMPPLAGALGVDGVQEVVAYVQQLSGQEADADLATAGEQRFALVCAACHGMDGTGNQALGAPNLTDDIWLYGGDTESITITIKEGRT